MKGVDDGPDGLNDAAFDRALGLRPRRRKAKPAPDASVRELVFRAIDTAVAIRADLVMWERETTEAPALLRAWAARHGRLLIETHNGVGMELRVDVGQRRISVHTLPTT